MVSGLNLFDIIQVLSMSKATKRLEIQYPGGSSMLCMENGDLVHAESGNNTGDEVAYRCLAEETSSFKEHPWEPIEERTVHKSTTYLLLEAARLKDEYAANKESNEANLPNVAEIKKSPPRKGKREDIIIEQISEIESVISSVIIKSNGEILAGFGDHINNLRDLSALMSVTGSQLQQHLGYKKMDFILIDTADQKKIVVLKFKNALLSALLIKDGIVDLVKSDILEIIRNNTRKIKG